MKHAEPKQWFFSVAKEKIVEEKTLGESPLELGPLKMDNNARKGRNESFTFWRSGHHARMKNSNLRNARKDHGKKIKIPSQEGGRFG